ncbi:MAG: 50S ribosomal protein L30 [Bacteroidia bacterium]|nr:50S ribosomal protein L30 [Bacteroidia bacterium]
MMAKIKITQVKSGIDRTKREKRTLIALGLKKLNQSKEFEENPAILGMINSVKHLLKVESV